MTRLSFVFAGWIAACSMLAPAGKVVAAADAAREWAGVWQMTSGNKAGGSVAIAYEGGALTGVIVFNVRNHDTGEHIGIETRAMIRPHAEGDALTFEVRGILRPRMQGDGAAAEDAGDIAEMALTRTAEGKGLLACAKCGSAWPVEVVKER